MKANNKIHAHPDPFCSLFSESKIWNQSSYRLLYMQGIVTQSKNRKGKQKESILAIYLLNKLKKLT